MIFFKRKYPDLLLALFDEAIESGAIHNWRKKSEFQYLDKTSAWRRSAYFDAKPLLDGLRMNLIIGDDVDDGRACYAAMHGSLLHAMLEHCSSKIFVVELSGDPYLGDSEID